VHSTVPDGLRSEVAPSQFVRARNNR
jgi:hypothetical protein